MDWNQITFNPKVILGYYSVAPSLKNVCVHRISLHRDGPSAEITFEPQDFPDKPSSKWPESANTCQILIRAFAVTQVDVRRWGTGVSGDLEISRTSSGIEVVLSGEGAFRLVCSELDVVSVVGYVSEGPNNSFKPKPLRGSA
ncbi:Imm50 family immunity protein [Lysobacter tyrosinilyticus]